MILQDEEDSRNLSAQRYGRAQGEVSRWWACGIVPQHREKRSCVIWFQVILVVQLYIQHSQAFTTSSASWKARQGGPLAFVIEKEHNPTPCGLLYSNLKDSRKRIGLSVSRIDDEDSDEDSDEDDVDDTSAEGRLRKRDRIKDWFSQNSGDDSRSRIKTKFDSLFGGMPSMSEILADKEGDQSGQDVGVRKGKKRDPAWFEEEKQRIIDR